jgi:DNA-binding CsgD family transcriptional regulator
MPRLSRAQEMGRQHILQLTGRGLLPTQLGKRLLGALQGAIPADGQMFCSVDPATLLFNRVLAQSPSLIAHTPWFLQYLYLQAEFLEELTHPNLMRAGLAVVIGRERPETSWGLPTQVLRKVSALDWYRAYHEIPAGGTTISAPAGGLLRAFFSAHGQWIAALELVRFEASRPFQPTDGAFLRLLAPTIGQLLSSAFTHERALASHSQTGTDASGILLLAPNGHVTFHTPPTESWITLLRHEEESLASHLPTAIWSALAQLRAVTGKSAQPVVRVPTSAGTLRVEASRGSDDGIVAVVLAPERRSLSPDLPPTWPLTHQEKQVVGLLIRGLSTREMASALAVSENTVETHLRHIYEKLNIHSRSELLTRFFHETYGPIHTLFPKGGDETESFLTQARTIIS